MQRNESIQVLTHELAEAFAALIHRYGGGPALQTYQRCVAAAMKRPMVAVAASIVASGDAAERRTLIEYELSQRLGLVRDMLRAALDLPPPLPAQRNE